MLVLIAEDSDTMRDVVSKLVTAMGHRVHSVRNGWHAVLACYAYEYDVVLMDMHMPIMDGWDATEMIRNLEAANGRPRMPIVAVTSLYDRQACLAGGLDDYTDKPLGQMQLQAILRKWQMKLENMGSTAAEVRRPISSEANTRSV